MTTPAITPAAYRDTTDEAALQETLTKTADALGFLWHHEVDSSRSNPGLPDLRIVGHGLDLTCEMKTATGKLRPQQREWLRELQRATVHETRLVRPGDLDGIIELLRRMAEGDRT